MRQEIKQKEIYLISGPATIKVNQGTISVIGAEFKDGMEFNLPIGKRVPVEAVTDCEIEANLSGNAEINKLDKKTIPDLWDELAEKIYNEKLKKILILGEVDTGKSFFTTYISNKLIQQDSTVGILDCDIGQSDVGPPGALGLAICKEKFLFLSQQPADSIYFIGSLSPGLHLTSFLTGIDQLTKEGEDAADFLIIDTTGWVHGDGGRQVKRSKIEIIQPDLVILLQRNTELEHLVLSVPEDKVFRLPVSKKASGTSQVDRKKLRELVSIKYFEGSKKYSIPLEKIITERVYFKTGTKLELDNPRIDHAEKLPAWEGALVFINQELETNELAALQKQYGNIRQFKSGTEKYITIALLDSNRKTLGLGTIEKFDFENNQISFYSPLSPEEISKVKIIQFGSNRTGFNGKEMGFIDPGQL